MSRRSAATALSDSGGFGTGSVAVVDDASGGKQHEGRRREEPQGPEANDARMRASWTERRTIDQLQVDVRSCGCRLGAHVLNKPGVSNPFEFIVLFNFPIYQNKNQNSGDVSTAINFRDQTL